MQHPHQLVLSQLQNEIIDRKITMSISQSINPLAEQINSLRHEIGHTRHEIQQVRLELHQDLGKLKLEFHQDLGKFKDEITNEIQGLKEDMSAVKARLGMRSQVQGEIRTRFFDYSFKAGWLIGVAALSAIISSLMNYIHTLV